MKTFKSITNFYNKLSNFGKILIFIACLLIIIVFFKSINPGLKEGMSNSESVLYLDGNRVYDDFYADIYDYLVYNTVKNDYEVGRIINATDDLYSKLNESIDSFIEVLLGKSGQRTNLTDKKSIRLLDLTSPESLKREVEDFKSYLVSLNDNKTMKIMSNTDLYNIRDEILGHMNQFLYLLTFK